ncbi:MAG: B12-binding domain-containing radical SAM protein [Thermoleophilia bacterium]|nr:B12-binding domain-containing radical SAM protein [Thermoleophilia bacterium]
MRIMLIQPPAGGYLGYEKLVKTEPLGLEALAAVVPTHEIELFDMRLDSKLEAALDRFCPDICAISCSFTMSVPAALACAQTIRRTCPGAFIVVGGVHASISPADFACSAVDAVVKGEGEVTFAELVQVLEDGRDPRAVRGLYLNTESGQIFTGARPLVDDLDRLPLPRRNLGKRRKRDYYFNLWRPFALVETARGCSHHCVFCSVWRFYQGKVRYKSPERVVAELAQVDAPYVLFTDDNFLGDISRAKRIAELLCAHGIEKKYAMQVRADDVAEHPEVIDQWHEAGLRHVLIGFEASTDAGLANLRKDTKAQTAQEAMRVLRRFSDIGVTGSFIVDPSFGKEDFARLRDYVASLGISSPQFTVLTPLPGTVLYHAMKHKLVTRDYRLFDFLHAVLPTRMGCVEFYREFANLYRAAYAKKQDLLRKLPSFLRGLASRAYTLSQLRGVVQTFKMVCDPDAYLESCPEEEELLDPYSG